MDDVLLPALEKRRTQSLYRYRRVVEGPQGITLKINGKDFINFCSNDYLGLANHPEVIKAFKKGADEYGVGAGASHLINGHSRAHHALEEELAEFMCRPRALLFSSGYMANLGITTALIDSKDTILEDRLNHASLIDAGRLSGARLQRYLHADPESLKNFLLKINPKQKESRRLIATDGVFSMDGNIAPLTDLAKVANQFNAWLMVDDAHGLGVLGKGGRGTVDHFGLNIDEVPILMATLGKAFGTFGAFVAGSEALIETLIQQARTYIYTTAMPPAVAVATSTSLQLLKAEGWRREKLRALIKRFRNGAMELGVTLVNSPTPIQPILIGDARKTVATSEALYERGIFISAIRPPTVPEGSSRLRITLSADHTEEHIDHLLATLETVK